MRQPGNADRSTPTPATVSGIQALHGLHQKSARPFWLDVWDQVVRRRLAWLGFGWLGLVAFLAVYAPLIANGHALWVRYTDESAMPVVTESGVLGTIRGIERSFPIVGGLSGIDVVLLVVGTWLVVSVVWSLVRGGERSRWPLVARGIVMGGLSIGSVVLAGVLRDEANSPSAPYWLIEARSWGGFRVAASMLPAAVLAGLGMMLPVFGGRRARVMAMVALGAMSAGVAWWKWSPPEPPTRAVHELVERGQAEAVFALVPWSPLQGSTELDNQRPGSSQYTPVVERVREQFRRQVLARTGPTLTREDLDRLALGEAIDAESMVTVRSAIATAGLPPAMSQRVGEVVEGAFAGGGLRTVGELVRLVETSGELAFNGGQFRFRSGTDKFGRDVLSQMLHACRIAIAIGLVSTSIAMMIGVTLGAVMGYFGGWLDLVLYRVVEVFMAVPVLFLLVVAAAVLPRNVFVMMAIIGCFSWTGAARFTRAEFLKLRNQDFVQSAKAAGLPLWSIMFKHMLPNGVTPVLVESSFAVAAAILIESVLAFLGLSPDNAPSWGRLLSFAKDQSGVFLPWLAVLPGLAIFMTVLSYNVIGEALRDAIDPKLKKAGH